ncbi:MAG: hypothetical protein R3B54_07850 [Bdellovibrionota bacterium]
MENSIVTAEVEYRLSDNYTVGVSHELVHSLIDETTGLRGSLKIFDGAPVACQHTWHLVFSSR